VNECGVWNDPGPCPVDDSPHTTCTSADYVPARVVVPIGAVTAGQRVTVPCGAPTPDASPTSFSTKTYSRAKHGPLIGKGRR